MVTTEYVGRSAEKQPGVCERSCEELGSMVSELSGLRAVVNQLHENLRKVGGVGDVRGSRVSVRAQGCLRTLDRWPADSE